jgi:hypothetical protein
MITEKAVYPLFVCIFARICCTKCDVISSHRKEYKFNRSDEIIIVHICVSSLIEWLYSIRTGTVSTPYHHNRGT